MTHAIWHYYCGGVGKLLAWLPLIDKFKVVYLPKYSRAFVNVIYSSEGMSHEDVERTNKLIEAFQHEFYQLVQQDGEEIHYRSPPYGDENHEHG